jgi:hypothetical protein
MKKYLLIILSFTLSLTAQFKEEHEKPLEIKRSLVNTNTSSLFGFFNPDNFSMRHSVSMSYSTMGSRGVALGIYTNSMAYRFAENLNVEVDASIVNSPYNSYGDAFTNEINGIYLSRAALNYKPMDNMFISIQYRGGPGNYYYPYGYSPFFRSFMYDRDPFEK